MLGLRPIIATITRWWARTGTGVVGAVLISLALDRIWTNPEPWQLYLVLAAGVILVAFAGLAGLLRRREGAMTGKNDERKESDRSTTVEIHKSPAGRDINVNVNQAHDVDQVYRGIQFFDKVGQVNIIQPENSPSTKTATFTTTESLHYSDKAFIDFKPRELFETGSPNSLMASSNVSSVSSTAVAGSTEFTLLFQNPLDGTKFNVTHGSQKISIMDVSSGSVTFRAEGDTPQQITIKVETSKDKK